MRNRQPGVHDRWVTGRRHELCATMSYTWRRKYQNGFNHSQKSEGLIMDPQASVGAILFTLKQLSPFPERLELPYPKGEIQSGYEEDVSFIQDRFATWVKADPNVTLERHMVDVRNAFAEYREASVRRQEAPAREYFFDNSVPNRSSVQKRLSTEQLESRTSTWKTGRYRKTNCRKVAYYHFAGGG